MKTLYTYIGFLFSALTVFSACADDADLLDAQNAEREFVTLSLNYESQNDKEILVSRSAAAEPEKRLYDLHFYVFDAKGNLTGYKKVLPESDNDIIEEANQAETISIRAKSGKSYVYAIANINKSNTYYLDSNDLALLNLDIDEESTDEEYNRAIEMSELTRDIFLGLQFKRIYGNENKLFSPDPADNVFVMSGYANDGNSVDIPKITVGAVKLPTVKLYRILAKNTLTITSGTDKGKFTPKYYRLCNVPISGNLIPNVGIGTSATYLEQNVTTADVESSYQWNFDGNEEITFYFPENLQVAKNSIGQWKDREKNTWNNSVKTFTNAADNAAYVEIYGDFVDHTGSVTANVNYTIHLGNFSNTGKLTDFNVVRNYAYKYQVMVAGVDDIRVEAQATNGEDNPYAEGMIVDATAGKHFNVDAHYEARVMTFKKSTITELKNNGSGYILNIKTPFGEMKETVNVKSDGVYNMAGVKECGLNDLSSLFVNEADYQWMKFVRNTEYNAVDNNVDISKSICKYPGDKMENGAWLNVFELLAQLYDESTYTDNNGTEAYYTCFIDENYYKNKSWPEYVNKESRSMLIANDLDVSLDGRSLYAKVAYSISQRSITTFYTTDYKYPGGENANDLVNAFGSEIYDEEKIYNSRFNNNNYGTILDPHDWNAWSSASNTNKNQNWYSDETKSVEGIQLLYTKAAKACMSRNRDLNGNGTIDSTEVKWYLAAVDQYRALFFGQNTLNPDAYLINREQLEEIGYTYRNNNNSWVNDQNGHEFRSRYHYFTSSSGDKTTFWPEEGLTNNPANKSGWVSEAQLIRCIRTLESGGEGLKDPEPFYTYEDNTFNLGGIKATRNYTEAPLEEHNEIEAPNNLYSSFVVAKQDLKNSNNRNTFSLSDITQSADDPCKNYANQTTDSEEKKYSWRSPNQKEIALMVSKLPIYEDNTKIKYGTRTKFSGSDPANGYWNWHNTQGFWSEGERINVGGGYESGVRIRCVRDKK